ncbi:carbohydrate esterase family 3 protein [Penicillium capsulatum]|uniref:Carbohydrate esterase family 3 protein n=1 Tax=Penicillium capsulatum TaxID=69766 RepID=A0A9W9HZP4_9EURO|nr:carbohydrate esterase family 3 protein [Penicillium capsulatum]KAJ6117195.1 carbohydrate esterase family 3 protein [Penicillium capsulatum]
MPLGGSVTRGVGSSDHNGYRKSLLESLQAHGFDVMMGRYHRGLRIDEIETKARRSVETWSPDVFTVNAASNDCLQSFKIDQAGQRMQNLLENLWLTAPHSTVLLSTLIVSADRDVNALVLRVNEHLRDLAARKIAQQQKIILVDLCTSEGPSVEGLVDGIHPDDE